MLEKRRPPIVIHSLWRSGSTYLWGKFQEQNQHHCAFVDPFHPSLKKSAIQLQTDFLHASKKFGFDHFQNYYKNFTQEALNAFRPRFSIDNYVMNSEASDDDMSNYIQLICDKAEEQNKTPVIKFNRATLRGKWMHETFGGSTIFLNRNIKEVVRSYRNHGYYLPCMLGLIGRNADHPVFTEMADYLGVGKVEYQSFFQHYLQYSRYFKGLEEYKKLEMAAFFWSLSLLHATSYADLIIDFDAVGKLGHEVNKVQENICSLTKASLDLSDMRVGRSDDNMVFISPEVRSIIRRAMLYIESDLDQLASASLAEVTKRQFEHFTILR